MFWIEGCLALEHGASDGEQAVGDTPQGAAMAMTSLAQFRITGAAANVVLDGDAGPMVDGGAQPQMTGLTHENHAALAAAPRHRGDAGQGAQRMIVSFAQRLRGLAEQRSEDDPSDARQGSQDRHVALLGFLPRRIFLSAFGELVGEFVEPAMRRGGGYRGEQDRDEEGRYRSEGRRSRSRGEDEDEGRYGGGYGGDRRSMGRGDEDEGRYRSRSSGEGRGREQGGWFGDLEGHSEAFRRGWERSGRCESGWYGDPEGHSQASRRGWEEGHRSQRRDEDYSRRGEGRYGRGSDYDDEDRRGGYGGRYESRRGGGRDGDDERYERSGRSRGGHGDWSGDPEGHSEAARRGWEYRR